MHENNNALVLEILKEPQGLSMSIFEQIEAASTLRHYSRLPVSFSQINKLCREIGSLLNKADKRGRLDAWLLESLKKSTQLLYDHLLTRQVKERLKSAESLDLILSLDEELVSIPWELLYTAETFLCLKFNLGRLVKTRELTHPPLYRSLKTREKKRMLILANPTNDLKSAYQEGLYIKNHLAKKRNQISLDFKSINIDTFYVKKNLRDYDIVHFAGHCEEPSGNGEDSGWVLSDGTFSPKDIRALGQSLSLPNLVFSNACSSAVAMGSDYQQKAYSLASAFLFSGVKHYIGTIHKIEDPVSLVFAKEFYTRLISGKGIGECVRLSRLRLIKEYGSEALCWMSYLLYGDPNSALFKMAPIFSIKEKAKRGVLRYKKMGVRVLLFSAILSISIYLYMWLPSRNPSTYILFLKSQRLYHLGRNEEAISLSSGILKKDPLFLAAYPLLADVYQRLGKFEQALKSYFEYVLACQKRQDKKSLCAAYIGLGWTYQLKEDYPKAKEFYQKALDLSREGKDKLHEARALRKLAVWHIDNEEYNEALELLIRSSEINRQRKHLPAYRYNLACDYFDLGLVFTNKEDFATAREFYNKSRSLFERLKLKQELSDYYFNLGEICLLEKEYQKALDYYLKGLKVDQAQGNLFSLVSDYQMLGELYQEMNNGLEAERLFKQSASLAKQMGLALD